MLTKTRQIAELLLTILLFSWSTVGTTGAYFFDTQEMNNNSIGAGWWQGITVDVTDPNKNDKFELGHTMDIKWTCTLADPSADYTSKIYLSLRGDKDYFEIKTLDNSCGPYTWDIPNNTDYDSGDVIVKVVVTDEHGNSGEDKSEKFQIKKKDTGNDKNSSVLGTSSKQPTATPTITEVPSPTVSPTITVTPEASVTPEPSITPDPTATPEATPTQGLTPTPTPEPSPSPKPTPTPEPTKEPTPTPTPEPKPTPEPTPEPPVEEGTN